MRKNIYIYFLIVFLFIFNGYSIYLSTRYLNIKRINYSKELLTKSEKSDNKLIYLIESDILTPKDDKKLEIANIYLKSGDFSLANMYLKLIKDPSGIVKYAESALEEGNYTVFNNLYQKINNEAVKNELIFFEKFTKGEYEVINSINDEPVTGLGKVLLAINKRDYSEIDDNGAIVEIINSQINDNIIFTELNISKSLIEMSQINIAKYLLNRINSERPEISVTYLLQSKIFEKENNYNKAIDYIKIAISKDPSNISYYEEGIILSEKTKNNIDLSFFKNRLDSLNSSIK